MSVFFNRFFEAEPFPVIAIAHGTHGRSQEFVEGVFQTHYGHIKSPENASSGRKCRLVPISQFNMAEPLDATGTPVEKHCIIE